MSNINLMNVTLNSQHLKTEAETEALRVDPSMPLEALPTGGIASKQSYASGVIARKAAAVGIPAYRFSNQSTGAHFYTTSTSEADSLLANFSSAFRLEGAEGDEHWLGLPNFFVITRYNRSVMYAMAVNQLAELLVDARGNN